MHLIKMCSSENNSVHMLLLILKETHFMYLIDNARISSLQNLLLSILKIIEAFLDLTMKNMYI